MSFINIINESFDKQNMNISAESRNNNKRNSLKENSVKTARDIMRLKDAFNSADDAYELQDLVDNLYYDFYEKACKIVEEEGFTDVFAEPSTEGMIGADFFTAYNGDVRYEGEYDYEEELNDIANIVINSDAKNREELINELAEWYADLILSTLKPVDDED